MDDDQSASGVHGTSKSSWHPTTHHHRPGSLCRILLCPQLTFKLPRAPARGQLYSGSTRVKYGYCVSEVPDIDIGRCRPDVVTKVCDGPSRGRRPVAVAICKQPADLVAFQPDKYDANNLLVSVLKRVGRSHPIPDKALRREFFEFVDNWIKSNLVPLPVDTDLSVGSWLADSNYTLSRQQELASVWSSRGGVYDLSQALRDSGCSSFIKAEAYLEPKAPRFINSRSDYCKCFFGPVAHAIEKVVYQDHHFIKHVPVPERPHYIQKLLGEHGPYYATDYSAFESQFDQELMANVEVRLYKYMLSRVEYNQEGFNLKDMFDAFDKILLGTNRCYAPGFRYSVRATRMSGEMFTSLGNGFTNLMVALFVAHKCGAQAEGVVEGDDGLFVFSCNIDSCLFERLGLTIKLETRDKISECLFCGICYDPREGNVLPDPLRIVSDFGFARLPIGTGRAKIRSHLRAKALSYLYSYAGCPIVQTWMVRILEELEDVTVDWDRIRNQTNKWCWDTYYCHVAGATDWRRWIRDVTASSRSIIADRYGVSISSQVQIEHEIMSSRDLLDPSHVFYWAPYFDREEVDGMVHYASRYVVPMDKGSFLPAFERGCHLPDGHLPSYVLAALSG